MWFWLLIVIAVLWAAYYIIRKIAPGWWTATVAGWSLAGVIIATVFLGPFAVRDGIQSYETSSTKDLRQKREELKVAKDRADKIQREKDVLEKEKVEHDSAGADAAKQRGKIVALYGVPLQPWDVCRFASPL